jgi:hypothetical protein
LRDSGMDDTPNGNGSVATHFSFDKTGNFTQLSHNRRLIAPFPQEFNSQPENLMPCSTGTVAGEPRTVNAKQLHEKTRALLR